MLDAVQSSYYDERHGESAAQVRRKRRLYPFAPLVDKGTLYGTTEGGGAHHLGTVFSVTTSGKEKY